MAAIDASHFANSVSVDAQVGCQLLVGRRATERVLELGEGALDLAGSAAYRPRHPVELAQAVVDGAPDARRGERLELHTALGIEAIDGVDQTEHAGADEVARVDAARQSGTDTTGDELDERRVVHDQVVTRGVVLALQPTRPMHRQIWVVGNDAHARG